MGQLILKGRQIILVCSIFYLFCVSISKADAAGFTPEELTVDGGELGIIRGGQQYTVNSRPYIQFLGIPYGEAPENENRFLPAKPKTLPLVDSGKTFEAIRSGPCCPQTGSYSLCAFNQKENCLFLNVFTPTPPKSSTKLLPVIVFIHGGGFTGGSSSIYTGARLLEERDVVIVNLNYRLGALGFFCLNTESAPGNAAMYDIREALIWVQTHISKFGGDPKLVTITGQSAGSAAVSHLMTSPLTRNAGLFHRAIAMSGTVLNEWATTTSDKAEKASLEIAEIVDCYDPTSPVDYETVVKCMHAIPAKELATKLNDYQIKENIAGRMGYDPISPVIQKIAPKGGQKFLDENPEDILKAKKQSKVPFIAGSTRHDGSFVLAVVYGTYIRFNNKVEDEAFLRTEMIPALLTALGIEDKTGAVFDAIANTYFELNVKNSGNLTVMLPGLTDMFTVLFFKSATFQTLKLHSAHETQSYWYNFDYKGERSVYSTLVPDKTIPVKGGVAHGDDLIYLFSIPYQSLQSQEDLAVSKRMVNYWINFAYTGNPNTAGSSEEFMLSKRAPQADQWPVFSEKSPNFAILGKEDEFISQYPNDYWLGATHELYPELYDPGLPMSTTEETTPAINDGESTTIIADEESTTALAGGESTTAISDGESTTALADGESTTALADGESTTALAGGESTTAISDGESTTAIADGESTTAIADGESTTAISDGESTTAIADGESTTALADGESTTAIADGESTTAIADGESTTALADEESTTALADEESTTALADEESTTALADGESTTALAGGESTTALAGGESTSTLADETSTLIDGESSTRAIQSTSLGTEDPPSTTDHSPIAHQSSYALLFVTTVMCLIFGSR